MFTSNAESARGWCKQMLKLTDPQRSAKPFAPFKCHGLYFTASSEMTPTDCFCFIPLKSLNIFFFSGLKQLDALQISSKSAFYSLFFSLCLAYKKQTCFTKLNFQVSFIKTCITLPKSNNAVFGLFPYGLISTDQIHIIMCFCQHTGP